MQIIGIRNKIISLIYFVLKAYITASTHTILTRATDRNCRIRISMAICVQLVALIVMLLIVIPLIAHHINVQSCSITILHILRWKCKLTAIFFSVCSVQKIQNILFIPLLLKYSLFLQKVVKFTYILIRTPLSSSLIK